MDKKTGPKAKLVTPPNVLKSKTGGGGFDQKVVSQAQNVIEENTVDFKPIALSLIEGLNEAVLQAKNGSLRGEAALDLLIEPAMQLRAQGSMFHYPLITNISDILVNFLETVTEADKDVLDIIQAHTTSLNVVLSGQIKGDGGIVGKRLCAELTDACGRYFKSRKN